MLEEPFPEMTVAQSVVNVFGGSRMQLTDTQLLLDDDVVVAWTDKRTARCKVSVALNDGELHDGDVVSEAGTLTVTVTNDQGKSAEAEVTLTCEAIYGLESLRSAPLQVDQQTDLLGGITLARGAELVKTEVEMDNKRNAIDPEHYTPEYPGAMNIIFAVKGRNGNTVEVKVENLTIKPLDYQEMSIGTANMIEEKYPWYKNLRQVTKDFIYPHLISSYAACNWSKLDNRVHIIM